MNIPLSIIMESLDFIERFMESLDVIERFMKSLDVIQGRIQDFKLGGAHLKKLRRAEGGAKFLGYFMWKITMDLVKSP